MSDIFDPNLDLVLRRTLDVPPELVWRCWTSEDHLPHWFVPKPWSVSECRIDLRPGGEFFTMMQSPDGGGFGSAGCYLEVVDGQRLVWTDALAPGWRPAKDAFFTAILELAPSGDGGTIYTATALHLDPEGKQKHEQMGFLDGWGTVVDQLVAYIKETF